MSGGSVKDSLLLFISGVTQQRNITDGICEVQRILIGM